MKTLIAITSLVLSATSLRAQQDTTIKQKETGKYILVFNSKDEAAQAFDFIQTTALIPGSESYKYIQQLRTRLFPMTVPDTTISKSVKK